jgi:hypothetical protein
MPASRSESTLRERWNRRVLISPVFTIKKGGVTPRYVLLTVAALLGLEACSVLPHISQASKPKAPATASAAGAATPAPSPKSSRWPPWKIFARKQIPTPPKAAPLLEVGTIRSISRDESYVIVELTPGTLVRSGETLLVTSKDHPVSRLKVAEVQPPCFAAEVEQGTVSPGDTVKR